MKSASLLASTMAMLAASASSVAETTGRIAQLFAPDTVLERDPRDRSQRRPRAHRVKSGYRAERPRKMPRAGWPAGTKLTNKARNGEITLRRGW
ncbi:hypothetical protein D3C87_687470 [compost metagenome]